MNINLSPYLKLKRIEFMVTYQCSGKCKHCSVAPRLNQVDGERHVRADKATEAIGTLSKLYEIQSVMTFGGEPLLYPDVVCAIHRKAAECGIYTRQIITSGYFTNEAAKRSKVAFALAQAGVNNLLLSVDVFHQETIPVESVYKFARDVVEAGIPNARLHPAWVVNEIHNNLYNAKTREVLAFFSNLGIPVSSGNNITMTGNAIKYLSQYYDKPKLDLTGKCGTKSHTSPLTEITSLSIVPNGDLMICGFVIGNIYREDVCDIVSCYDLYSNELMRTVAEGRVSALLEYAQKAGINVELEQCYSICDICNTITSRINH